MRDTTANEVSRIDTQVLAGRYRLLNPLAEGGMGTVWLAADETLRRDVAVKEVRLPPDLPPLQRQDVFAAALREANLAARLKHPSIITIHDVVVEDDRPWIVMELLTGESLERTVTERRPLPPIQAARVGVGIVSALAAAHAAGVLHRDVKPGNIFLTRTGKAVLTDFGIAVAEGDATSGQTSRLVGSPNYIAPERLRGERGGPHSDLWSLGATLYFAVEGVPPHPAETPISALSKVLTEPPRPPERAGALGPLLMRMLDPLPVARPSFEEVSRVLGEIALDRPASALSATADHRVPSSPAPTGPDRTSPAVHPARGPRRGRALLWAAAEVAAVAAVIGTTMAVVHLTGDRTAEAGPVELSEKPGAFATPVDLCTLVTAERVRQLLPALTGGGKPNNKGGCEWTTSGKGLSVDPAGLDKQWGKSPRQAHELFVNRRNGTIPTGQIAWSWPEISAGSRSARNTGPLPVKPVGEESFGYDVYENRKTGRLEQSYVTLRVDNLVVEVGYTVVDGTKDGPAIRSGAHTAATWIAEALNKQKATG
ncbi:serine/threonine protein kinase [Planomonospora sp. ID67723]|uniref:serine/threonine-protein kinase n=1 Tax=Planomonospora sp. ID67723 TaxID=2738134 RepID=UPI0018C3B950|nr:serine/threonine-protein kinase [Planomonospora sp. ID67723]MBG0828183.1 serine/threonine protein kinase [Planomonospora sp. ID67723]